MEMTEEGLYRALSRVIEPDLKKDIVELDLVQEVVVDENTVSVIVEVSNPAMHSRKRMEEAVVFQLKQAFGEGIRVNVSVRPISGARGGLRKVLPHVKHIVAVASGKGGVGKSTITANLAAGLARRGLKVGLVDADIYGPSMPMMFDVQQERPRVRRWMARSSSFPWKATACACSASASSPTRHRPSLGAGPWPARPWTNSSRMPTGANWT
jgi:ATP-binding protein involved in chromosome partitioning